MKTGKREKGSIPLWVEMAGTLSRFFQGAAVLVAKFWP